MPRLDLNLSRLYSRTSGGKLEIAAQASHGQLGKSKGFRLPLWTFYGGLLLASLLISRSFANADESKRSEIAWTEISQALAAFPSGSDPLNKGGLVHGLKK